MTSVESKSYVLFPLGEQRFALPAEKVIELARQDQLHTFPHRTPLLSGVLIRRGRVIPVCDVAQVLVGPEAPARKFYLLAACHAEKQQELMAIPVTSECELTNASAHPPVQGSPAYLRGVLTVGEETISIVDLEALLAGEVLG